jgi:hypothetical protein
VQATAALETLRREQTAAWSQWKAEREALSEALREAKAQGDHWDAIESMLSSLRPPADVSVERAPLT